MKSFVVICMATLWLAACATPAKPPVVAEHYVTQVIAVTLCGDTLFFIAVFNDGVVEGYDLRREVHVVPRAADDTGVVFHRVEVATDCETPLTS